MKRSHYQSMIADATGVQDDDALRGIEQVMRSEHPTLDHLSARRFVTLACRARAEWDAYQASKKIDPQVPAPE